MNYTEKAKKYFLSTGMRFPNEIVWAMGLIKASCAYANQKLGVLEPEKAEAIIEASMELAEGKLAVEADVFQTGSGTGLNMNVNEAIAERARELGVKVHPNDDVNRSQSSNDVVPSAIRLATLKILTGTLRSSLSKFLGELEGLTERVSDVIKPGRTHLRDALPVTMGQEFGAYVNAFKRIPFDRAEDLLKELPLGGTAVGTGVNTPPGFAGLAIEKLRELSGLDVRPAENRFRAMKLLDDMLFTSGILRLLATDLFRLCQDIRLMFSGPFTGIGEIEIEQDIPGSSMMPGKSNPVTVEAVMLASSQIIGLDRANEMAFLLGEFEMSMGVPLVARNLIMQATLASKALESMVENVLSKIRPKRERCKKLAESSPALLTTLSPVIGYDRASKLAKEVEKGRPIREVLKEMGYSDEELEKMLDLQRLVKPPE